ncbi:hypothetical protein BJ875DRAFT_42812 [Amylocarpus encephaloides]|uniref:Uncharacterized protein n=1 Tax=Amylocarpus encephaloides TaxID=45428 RepID=A0A9P8C4H8_9HELO|nr:hypothetical protein BJ875DRAFT_42812 [Amylocarpus encephaloides]
MWKRLNNPKGARQPTPTTTFPESRYDGHSQPHPRSHGLGIEIHSPVSPPPRPPRDEMESKGLPRLPFELAPPSPPEQRSSKFRPVSSIYSQPSPTPIVTKFSKNSPLTPNSPYTNEEVSPPSSPEFDARKRSQTQPIDEEVSPIDEMPDISKLGMGRPSSRQDANVKGASSSIPVLRREKRRNQVAAAAANLVNRKEIGGGGRPAKNPSWDPYSGEPTTSERGKKQTTKPGEFTPTGLRPVHGATGVFFGNESNVSAATVKKPISFGERVRKLANAPVPESKPQWKGASGRVTLVTTPADRLDIPPLSIPRKDPQHVHSPTSGPGTTMMSPLAMSPHLPRSGHETDPGSAHSERVVQSAHPDLDNAEVSPRVNDISTFISSVANQGGRNQVRENFPIETRHQEHPVRQEEKMFLEYQATEEPYIQPPSRFSFSTYAASEARSTPRPSTDTFEPASEPPPPMPSPPTQYQSSSPDSVLNRVRPKVGAGPRNGVTRKAVNTASPIFISMTNKRASKIGGKSLPSTPAEVESQDLVTSLQAQLDDLQHRKNNITRSIRQMTELMPADNITLTTEVRRKRENEKRKVEGLREEEADVRQQEHEIGLRLHRAWKRKDKEATYEPTGLWVRRVTG